MDDDIIIDALDDDIIIEEQGNENEEIIIDEPSSNDGIEVNNEDIIVNIKSQNYNDLENKPSIEGIILIENKSFKDLGAINLTNIEIENLINLQV